MREEPERRKEVEDRIEPPRPARWHLPHVTPRVAKILPSAALPCDVQQIPGVIQTVDVVAKLSQQMCMPALPAGDIEHPRSDRKTENGDEPRSFLAIPLEGE